MAQVLQGHFLMFQRVSKGPSEGSAAPQNERMNCGSQLEVLEAPSKKTNLFNVLKGRLRSFRGVFTETAEHL